MKIGYIRSHSKDQFYDTQKSILQKEVDCGRIFEDLGNNFKELEHMVDYIRPEDIVFVYQLDRFGLKVKDLTKLTCDLTERNVAICSFKDNIDTSKGDGELLVKIFNVLALCEKNAISNPEASVSRNMGNYSIKNDPMQGVPIGINGVSSDLDLSKYKNIQTLPVKSSVTEEETQEVKQKNVIQKVVSAGGGRPRGLTDEGKQKAEAAAAMYQEGTMSMREIASNLNISTATLYTYLRHEKVI